MEEIWKDVKGYEGLYQVSNLGRVKSLSRALPHTKGYIAHYKGKLLPLQKCRNYSRVGLSKNGKQTGYFVHRLVAEAFIPNPDNLPEVNHKDENPSNNNVNNLEWCSHLYNSNYGTRRRRISETTLNNPYTSQAVLCVETGIVYPSAHEASRQTNVNLVNLCRVCRGERNQAGGYHWKYV